MDSESVWLLFIGTEDQDRYEDVFVSKEAALKEADVIMNGYSNMKDNGWNKDEQPDEIIWTWWYNVNGKHKVSDHTVRILKQSPRK